MAATRAASPRSTAPSSSTSASWASPLSTAAPAASCRAVINGEPSYMKRAQNGDFIVMSGGRIGKDGIHGATFSSEELSEASPTSAVQIGDPITQKRMTDFLLIARDEGLYNSITDDGAGGLLVIGRGDGARIPMGASSTWRRRPSSITGSIRGRSC